MPSSLQSTVNADGGSNTGRYVKGPVTPEVVLYGEPRLPPPPLAVRELDYHLILLQWARHASFCPSNSAERSEWVFPRGRNHPESGKYRINDIKNVKARDMVKEVEAMGSNVQQIKAYIESNIDLVPPLLFMRIIAAEKLTAQSKRDVKRMRELKTVLLNYICAFHQLMFPMQIEVQKAETRVLTFINRMEFKDFALVWDEVETSLVFFLLYSAKASWRGRAESAEEVIEEQLKSIPEFLYKRTKNNLFQSRLAPSTFTYEVYGNSTAFLSSIPEIYAKVRPEIKILHELDGVDDDDAIVR